jgi:hypothetical protein
MPITLGDTTITGLGVGGLPSGSVTATTLAKRFCYTSKIIWTQGYCCSTYLYQQYQTSTISII